MMKLNMPEQMVDRLKFGDIADIILELTETPEESNDEPVLGLSALKELG